MGKETGFDLARHRNGSKLRGIHVASERTRIINQGGAVGATEDKSVVIFNAITLGAALHVLIVGAALRGRPRVDSLTIVIKHRFVGRYVGVATEGHPYDPMPVNPFA